jgi:anti-sigma factor RsiW
MNCQEYRKQRLLDHEQGPLSPEAQLHIAACVACQGCEQEEELLRAELRKLASSERTPQALRQSIAFLSQRQNLHKERGLRQWMLTAAAAVLVIAAAGGMFWKYYDRTPSPQRMAQAFVADHLEYLPGREAIISDSPQQAQEWLQARMDFTVPVPKIPGSVLESARICDVSGRKAALLQYRHATSDTLVSLFVTAEPMSYEREKMPINVEAPRQGVRSTLWCHHGLVYSVVAALDDASLQQIADAVREQAP